MTFKTSRLSLFSKAVAPNQGHLVETWVETLHEYWLNDYPGAIPNEASFITHEGWVNNRKWGLGPQVCYADNFRTEVSAQTESARSANR